MRCAVWTGGGDFRLEEQPIPEPGPDQVLVRVHTCGVCMTELHSAEGHFGLLAPPRVLGHEYSGVVEALGSEVSGLGVGQAVASAGGRGFAEYAVVSADRLYPLPTDLPIELGAFAEPVACCLTAVETAGRLGGAAVLVTGAGPMGLILAQLARRAGAAALSVSDPVTARRELARRLGADRAFAPTASPQREGELDRGDGGSIPVASVDVAFEASGQPAALADCIEAVRAGGLVVMVGISSAASRFSFPSYEFHRRNLTLRGSYGMSGPGAFAQGVRLLPELQLEPLVSHRFDLADIAEAFSVARKGQGAKVFVCA